MRLERLLALLALVGIVALFSAGSHALLTAAGDLPAESVQIPEPVNASPTPAADPDSNLTAVHRAIAAKPDPGLPVTGLPTGHATAPTRVHRAALTAATTAWGPLYGDSAAHGVRIAANGCPTHALPGTAPDGLPPQMTLTALCTSALRHAPDRFAVAAIRFAFLHLGSTYACGGVGREDPWTFDCSSFVSRAYLAAGVATSVHGWSPTTTYMLSDAQRTFVPVTPAHAQPGDLVLYDTCPSGQTCTYHHVVMYLGSIGGRTWMLQTNACGSPAKLSLFWGWGGGGHGALLGVRRVRRPTGPAPR